MSPLSPRMATVHPSRRFTVCAALALVVLLALALAPAARAAFDVTVSQAATTGGAIDAGVFEPTADDAVLDVDEANSHLATDDLWIVTGTGGDQDGDVRVEEPLSGPGRELVLRPAGALTATAGLEVGTLVLDGAGEVTGLVTGAGGQLVKTGAGAVRLAADNTYTGATIVDWGELQVDGDQPASAVELDGGTLTGTGGVGAIVQGEDASTVAPGGAAPGTLATGSLTLGAATMAAFEVDGTVPGDGPDHHDQLAVTGTVALGDATLSLALDAVPPIGAPLTLIANDGADPVTGAFADLPEGATTVIDGIPLRISYAGGDGNDVTLTVQRAPSEVELAQSEPWTLLGAPLRLSAIVVIGVAPPFPSGTITFASDGVAIGSAPLDAFGIASIETAALPVGWHQITATYGGDAGTEGSSSLPTPHEVRAVTPPPPPPPPEPPGPPSGGEDDDRGAGNGGDGRRGTARPVTPADPPRVVRDGRTRVVRHGRTLVVTTGFALACPRADRICTAAISLQSRRADGRRATIGRGSARVRSGRTAALTLRTDRRSAPRLARGERERVTVVVTARTGAGAPVTTRRVVRMRLQRRG